MNQYYRVQKCLIEQVIAKKKQVETKKRTNFLENGTIRYSIFAGQQYIGPPDMP